MPTEVELLFTGPVRRPPGVAGRGRVSLPEGVTTIAALLAHVGFPEEDRTYLRAVVDGAPSPLDRELGGGEQVTVFLPVGGG